MNFIGFIAKPIWAPITVGDNSWNLKSKWGARQVNPWPLPNRALFLSQFTLHPRVQACDFNEAYNATLSGQTI
jgi:hypothetical protein